MSTLHSYRCDIIANCEWLVLHQAQISHHNASCCVWGAANTQYTCILTHWSPAVIADILQTAFCIWLKCIMIFVHRVSTDTKSYLVLVICNQPQSQAIAKQFIDTNMHSDAFINCSSTVTQVQLDTLTHWGRDKIDAISQTTFLISFSWMKIFEFRLKFHWSLFQLTIFQHWFG